MAINWNEIDGYNEDMTDAEKLALLEQSLGNNDDGDKGDKGAEPPKNDTPKNDPPKAPTKKTSAPEGYISKRKFDELASQLASTKKELRARMSDDEQKELDRQVAEEEMKMELETLRKEKAISSHTSSFLALGFDEELASKSAMALSDGDIDAVFDSFKKYKTNFEKELRAQILKETPRTPAGDDAEKLKEEKEMEALRKAMGLAPKSSK